MGWVIISFPSNISNITAWFDCNYFSLDGLQYESYNDVIWSVQSALTGESLPVTKRTGDEVFSGSTCKHGEIEAVVIATGVHSFLGKAAHLVDSTEVIGHFQKVI